MIAVKERKRMLLDDIDMDWTYTDTQVSAFRKMWQQDAGIGDIATELGWEPTKVALMVIDQAEKGLIEQRRLGLGV